MPLKDIQNSGLDQHSDRQRILDAVNEFYSTDLTRRCAEGLARYTAI